MDNNLIRKAIAIANGKTEALNAQRDKLRMMRDQINEHLAALDIEIRKSTKEATELQFDFDKEYK